MAECLFYWKIQNNIRLGIFFIEKAKIRYGRGFTSLKMLKQGTAGNLFHWKNKNKVGLEIYYIEKPKIRYGWEFISLKKQK